MNKDGRNDTALMANEAINIGVGTGRAGMGGGFAPSPTFICKVIHNHNQKPFFPYFLGKIFDKSCPPFQFASYVTDQGLSHINDVH